MQTLKYLMSLLLCCSFLIACDEEESLPPHDPEGLVSNESPCIKDFITLILPSYVPKVLVSDKSPCNEDFITLAPSPYSPYVPTGLVSDEFPAKNMGLAFDPTPTPDGTNISKHKETKELAETGKELKTLSGKPLLLEFHDFPGRPAYPLINTFKPVFSERDPKLNRKDANGNTKLIRKSLQQWPPKIFQKLLKRGADPNAQDSEGQTPLHLVLRGDKKDEKKIIVRLLLVYGADPNIQDNDGLTALHEVLRNGNNFNPGDQEYILRLLLFYGADPNIQDNDGLTALHEVLKCGGRCKNHDQKKEYITKLLLFYGADPNIQDNDGQTTLHYVSLTNTNLLQMLFDKGADPNIETHFGRTVLTKATYFATEGRHLPTDINPYLVNKVEEYIIDFLLNQGAKPKGVDNVQKTGSTALYYAAKYGNKKLARLFLEKRADPDFLAWGNETALTAVITSHFLRKKIAVREDIVKLLLNYEADPNIQRKEIDEYYNHNKKDGSTPLLLATKLGYESIVQLLLDYEADPNLQNNEGDTPLLSATYGGYETIVQMLLDYKADPNLQNNEGDTPLHYAVQGGYLQEVQYLEKSRKVKKQEEFLGIIQDLLTYEADPNIENIHGRTAINTNFLTQTIIQILLDYDADPNNQDKQNGVTALMRVAVECNVDSVKLLLENGADPNIINNRLKKYYNTWYPSDIFISYFTTALNGAIGRYILYKDSECVNVVKILLKHYGDPNLKVKGKSTLQWLEEYHYYQERKTEIIQLLLDYGVTPNNSQ